MNDERLVRIAREIVARSRMARGVLVLDESLYGLESALGGANIKVVTVPSGMNDDWIKENLLPHRIIVTRNSADFIREAPIHEYGVISLEKLTFIDSATSFEQNKTARLISDAMSQFGLWVEGAKFLLELRDDGNHDVRELR